MARVTRTIHRLTVGRKGEHHGLRSDPDPQQYIDGDSHLHRDHQDLAGLTKERCLKETCQP